MSETTAGGFAQFEAVTQQFNTGVWRSLAEALGRDPKNEKDPLHNVELCLVSTASTEFERASQRAQRGLKGRKRYDPTAIGNANMSVAHVLLKDWKNVTNGTEPIPFSPAAAEDACHKFPWLAEAILGMGRQLESGELADEDDEEKNSSGA